MRPYLHTIAMAAVGRLGPRALLGHRWFVNEGTIRRWVRAGKLRGYRAGRVLRVRRDELDRMLATGRHAPSKASNDESPEELAMRAIANRGMR